MFGAIVGAQVRASSAVQMVSEQEIIERARGIPIPVWN
jgi:hypothetical protein